MLSVGVSDQTDKHEARTRKLGALPVQTNEQSQHLAFSVKLSLQRQRMETCLSLKQSCSSFISLLMQQQQTPNIKIRLIPILSRIALKFRKNSFRATLVDKYSPRVGMSVQVQVRVKGTDSGDVIRVAWSVFSK
jgi:hypothetical protein